MIYLDHNATSPLLPSVQQAMAEAFEAFGNASSAYEVGRDARAAYEAARRRIAEAAGAEARDVIFTSGGTESNNTVLFGTVDPAAGDEIVLAPHDHSSVVESARELERRGARLRWLDAGRDGRIDPSAVERSISDATALVTVCWGNNEIGTVQDADAIASICRDRGVAFHTDAVQAFGKIGTHLPDADLVSITAHKLGGPKGCGALIRRRGAELRPLLYGGSQERGVRPGTENVVGACGFAAAVTAAEEGGAWSTEMREHLWQGLVGIAGAERYSPEANCLPNTLLVGFSGLRGESVVAALDLEGIAVSVGSACAAGSGEPSHVLQALGYDDDQARGGVRFSCGRETSPSEIDTVCETVVALVGRMRSIDNRDAAGSRQ